MKVRFIGLVSAVALAIGLSGVNMIGQSGAGADTPDKHLAAAKAAAGQDWAEMYDTLCVQALGRVGKPPVARGAGPARGAQPPGPPARETYHAEPVKVFDNVYWFGTKEHSAWAITTSNGVILMDAIFDYNIQDEVVDGMKKVGLNPASIKEAIIGHWHGDHAGGTKTLQELFGTKIIMGPADWDNMDKQKPAYKPKKDVVATDGMKVTLGDTTVTTYLTPGHTQGTLSSIFTVKDNGTPHVVAYWGGTLYNWIGATNRGTGEYVGKPESFWFTQYADSAARFKDIAAKAGADVYLSNHTAFDGSKQALPKFATRKPGDPNPYVVGKDSVQRYMTMAGECARAGALMSK
jgi:metallo-beta-lactamase class B